MKRILALLILAVCLSEAQVQPVYWSKKSAEDTTKTAWGPNLGILAKFVTFPDGTKMLTAAGFSDTSKYVEKPDSLIGAGYATRTMLQADSNYARALFARDTTYRKAQEDAIRLDTVYARAIFALDTTYKATQLLLRIKYADSTNSPGYVTRTQFRADSLYDRAIFALDTTYKAAELLKKILYSDTTSSVAMQWELDGKIAKSDTSAFPSVVPARNSQSGWWTKPVGWSYLEPATASDTLRSRVAIFGKGFNTGLYPFAIQKWNGTNVADFDTLGNLMLGRALGGALYFYGTGQGLIQYSGGFSITTLEATPIVFKTSNVSRLTIALTGNVGIGMTSASTEQIAIKGSTTTTDLMNWYRAGSTTKVAGIDSSGNAAFVGFVDHQGTNSATVTAGAGDSIQVSVTGVTITSQIVATYAATTALTDVPTGIRNRQTGKFTIQATSGKDVTYWIAKK